VEVCAVDGLPEVKFTVGQSAGLARVQVDEVQAVAVRLDHRLAERIRKNTFWITLYGASGLPRENTSGVVALTHAGDGEADVAEISTDRLQSGGPQSAVLLAGLLRALDLTLAGEAGEGTPAAAGVAAVVCGARVTVPIDGFAT